MPIPRLGGSEGVSPAAGETAAGGEVVVVVQLVVRPQLWEHTEASDAAVGPARCNAAQCDAQQGTEELSAWQAVGQAEAGTLP